MTDADRQAYRRLAQALIVQVVSDAASTDPTKRASAKQFMFDESPAFRAARLHWLERAELPRKLFDELRDVELKHLRLVLKRRGNVKLAQLRSGAKARDG